MFLSLLKMRTFSQKPERVLFRKIISMFLERVFQVPPFYSVIGCPGQLTPPVWSHLSPEEGKDGAHWEGNSEIS